MEVRGEDNVGMGLRDASGHCAYSDLGYQLDVDPAYRVRVLKVKDELGQVLDGIDVVMRRRGDKSYSRCGVSSPGDPGVNLVARQLPAFTGLGTLRHLDLEVIAVNQVLAGHTEASRGHLFDG